MAVCACRDLLQTSLLQGPSISLSKGSSRMITAGPAGARAHGRPVHLRGGPHRLQPGTSPHALRIPPHDGHPALRKLRGSASGPPWSVSGFRLRARLDFSIPSSSSGQRGITPAFGYSAPHPSARGTSTLLNKRAAQRTLWPSPTPRLAAALSGDVRGRDPHQSRASLTDPDHLPCMPCSLPRWTGSGARWLASCAFPRGFFLSVLPSPLSGRVGVHITTFEACSSFTRVTACRVAHPPYVGFIARLRPGRFPGSERSQATKFNQQPPWVGPSPTGDLRR